MSLEHVRIKEEVEWPDEGSSGFKEVLVPMYEGLQPKMEVELDLNIPKRENDFDEAVEDNDFENLTSKVHVKDEEGSEMGVSEAAALAELYNGCLVKEEMVIGPELVQYRVPEASLCSKSEAVEDNDFENLTSQVHVKDEAESEMGVSEAAALAGLYNGCLVKEEMGIGPELVQYRDSYSQAASNLNQETPDIDEPFSCKTCLIKAKHRSKENIQHKRQHMGRTFNCQTCQFLNEKYLDFHIKVHTGERPYVCEVCDKKFAIEDDLVEHREDRRLHEPLSCLICNKKFWRRAYLNEHKKIHANERLFKCDVCMKQFNDVSDLITHKLIHADLRPFSCELCEKKFIVNSRFISHMRQHTTPFSCEFCPKQFKTKQLLVSHTRNRHAKETLSYDTCSKEFTNKEYFFDHICVHDELTCDVCFKRFRRKYQLAKHKREHTASR